MKTPGYYALPLHSLPKDVFNNFNHLTLFSRPNDRIVRLANDLVTQNFISPTTPSSKSKNIVEVIHGNIISKCHTSVHNIYYLLVDFYAKKLTWPKY